MKLRQSRMAVMFVVGALATVLAAGAPAKANPAALECAVGGYVSVTQNANPSETGTATFQPTPVVPVNGFVCAGPINGVVDVWTCAGAASCISGGFAFDNNIAKPAIGDTGPCENPGFPLSAACNALGGPFAGSITGAPFVGTESGIAYNCTGSVDGVRGAVAVVVNITSLSCSRVGGGAGWSAFGEAAITFAPDPANLGSGCNFPNAICAFVAGEATLVGL